MTINPGKVAETFRLQENKKHLEPMEPICFTNGGKMVKGYVLTIAVMRYSGWDFGIVYVNDQKYRFPTFMPTPLLPLYDYYPAWLNP